VTGTTATTATHPTGAAPSSPTAAILSLSGVRMCFPDGTEALDGVSLDVAPGEIVAIVGPSGCGKSTLLRIVSGLARPTGGAITTVPRNVGYVFQDATLLPWRTVQTNVELLAELEGVPAARRRALAASAIQLTGLTGFEGHRPHELSGGMRMRVSLARSLTLEPSLFLFDEPFGALDEMTRERLNDELVRLFVERRFGGLFVTHSIAEAVFLSSRVLVMSERPGRFLAEIAVPFAYPREQSLRYDPAFTAAAAEVAAALRTGSATGGLA
jgi:NitT/TauT family transport system ATP-binding protein